MDAAGTQARIIEALAGDASVVRAAMALRDGRAEAAIALLSRPVPSAWFGHAVSASVVARSHERFLRAEALAAAGRPTEARAWFRSLTEYVPADLPYLSVVPTDDEPVPLRAARPASRR
jgi:hypothetical protein